LCQTERRPRFRAHSARSFRPWHPYLGYRGDGDALAELINNALEAYAERGDVLFGYDGATSSKKPLQLAVVDDGEATRFGRHAVS
jgi:hypothetical protein